MTLRISISYVMGLQWADTDATVVHVYGYNGALVNR
jgi:hypothetical protein